MKHRIHMPLREGVGASCVALPPGPWLRIGEFLAARFPTISTATWDARMNNGDVMDADGITLHSNSTYRPHTKIFYYRTLEKERAIPFYEKILYQDDFIVAVDKPHFLPVAPSGAYLQETLLVRLKRKLGYEHLVPMHRIDRDTAGVVLFTVNAAHRGAYQALFRCRKIKKIYHAVAPIRDDLVFPYSHHSRLIESAHFMQMCEISGPPNAEILIEQISKFGTWALYRLIPTTGQRHQIRVQMASLGMPILNDRIYPALQPILHSLKEPDYSKPLQLLAHSIQFVDPISKIEHRFESKQRLAEER